MDSIGGLFITSAVTIAVTFILSLCGKLGVYKKIKINPIFLQVLIGLVFAGVSLLATFLGWTSKVNSNVRDASVITAGLVFGPISGLVAGGVGAVLRLLYTFAFGLSGELTTTTIAMAFACSFGTLLAGVISSVLKCTMFKGVGKDPSPIHGLVIAIATEVLHMLMIFITFLIVGIDTNEAALKVKTAMVIMIPFNALTTFITLFLDTFITDKSRLKFKNRKTLPTILQVCLLVGVLVALVVISLFLHFTLMNFKNIDKDQATSVLVLVLLTLFILCAAIFMNVYFLVDHMVCKKIDKINDTLLDIRKGNLNSTVDIRTNLEFSRLSDGINYTVSSLKQSIKDVEERNKAEMALASNIQIGMLPTIFPNSQRLEIFASMNPAREVGGDFYDFFYIDDFHVAIVVADVSGKGIPAAMFMMRAMSLIKTYASQNYSSNEVLYRVNNSLCEGNDAGMFVTIYLGIIDLRSGVITCSNAGHDFPIIYADGKAKFLENKKTIVCGAFENINFPVIEYQLEPGNIIFLYTDGVTEAQNKNEELFGMNRLLETVNNSKFNSVREMCEDVKINVDKFANGAPQFDDMTMLGFKYKGSRHKSELHVKATKERHKEILDFVNASISDLDQKIQNKINICIDEIFTNIVSYAFNESDDNRLFDISVSRTSNEIKLVLSDNGKAFNPLERKDPDISLSAEDREIGGLGIFIVKKVMDEVSYTRDHNLNVLTLVKKI